MKMIIHLVIMNLQKPKHYLHSSIKQVESINTIIKYTKVGIMYLTTLSVCSNDPHSPGNV